MGHSWILSCVKLTIHTWQPIPGTGLGHNNPLLPHVFLQQKILLGLLGFKINQPKLILMAKGHILGWHTSPCYIIHKIFYVCIYID